MIDLVQVARGRVVVVGIGNTLKADDGAGSIVAQTLSRRHPDVVIDAGQTPENFVGPIRRSHPDTLVLVDASDFGGAAGEIRVASADEVGGLMLGTHASPLSMFMTVVREETGARVHLVAVQAKTTELGGEMSDEVRCAIDNIVRELDELLKRRGED